MKLRVNILDQRRRVAAIGLSAGIGVTVLIALLLSLQLVTTAAPSATTWYVYPNGSDSDAGTLGSPFKTIQHAIGVADHDDTIVVAAGTFTENLVITKALTLRGSHIVSGTAWLPPAPLAFPGTEGTIVNGSKQISQSVVTIQDGGTGTVLEGFAIVGGEAERGAGILIRDAAPTVRNCIVVSNTATGDGGGILIEGHFAYWASGCLSHPLSTLGAFPTLPTTTESITVYVEDTDVVMRHTNAIYNCCATMVVDLEDQSPLLRLIERETFPDSGRCFCLCPYNIGARISDLAPGDYQVEVWDEPNQRLVISVTVTVPGVVTRVADTGLDAVQYRPVIQACTIANNVAGGGGGGIALSTGSSVFVTGTWIYANVATGGSGGGVRAQTDGDVWLINSWVVANAAPNDEGGGVTVGTGGSSYVENSVVAGNTSGASGGGFWLTHGLHRIVNSDIVGNEAITDGAAIATAYATRVEVINTLIISNVGNTGISNPHTGDPVVLLSYCDTFGNSSDGTNGVTIIRTNCLGVPPAAGLDPRWVGGTLPAGVGPAFAAQWASYDYRLQVGSPAIDAGTSVGAPATDIEGTLRDATPDMGAYEWTGQAVYTTTISPGLGGILIYTDTRGPIITVQVPAGAVNYTATLAFTPILSPTDPVSPGLRFTGYTFDLEFYWNDQPPSGFTFSGTVTITIHYSGADMAGIDEKTLKLYRWVPPNWEVIGARPGEGQTLDTANNMLTAWLRSLGRFKVMGTGGGYDIFLPLVSKSGTAR